MNGHSTCLSAEGARVSVDAGGGKPTLNHHFGIRGRYEAVRRQGQIFLLCRFDDIRRDDDHKFAFVILKTAGTKQGAQNRKISQKGKFLYGLGLERKEPHMR